MDETMDETMDELYYPTVSEVQSELEYLYETITIAGVNI